MKNILVLFCFVPCVAFCQLTDANLRAMVETEQAFINKARDYNTREAFLYYLSDDAVTAGPYGPVVGKAELKKQKPNASLLSWNVAYCDIASSGDFGYNTGPWEFKTSRTDSVPAAYGEFHSIWKKQSDGAWKNFVDIGIHHAKPTAKEDLKTSSLPMKTPARKIPAVESIISLMNQEKAFLERYKKDGLTAYTTVASSEIRYAREGELPITASKDKAAFLKSKRHPYFNPVLVDGGIASSGDMGYVYGTIDAIVFVDDKQESKKATYLRVWKKEDGKTWKIVLDVIGYQ